MNIYREKQDLRSTIRELKEQYTAPELAACSSRIFSQLEKLPVFREAGTVMIYWALPGEVRTQEFILKWYGIKNFLLPVVRGDELRIRMFRGLGLMAPGEAFNIREPEGEDLALPESIDLIVVPGIAFDRENNRLGRGKAYYDKFLKVIRGYKLGVCFSFQMVEKIPVSPDDIGMDRVLYD